MELNKLTTIKALISEFSDVPDEIFQRQSNGNWIYILGFEKIERDADFGFIDVVNKHTYEVYIGYVIKLTGETTLDNFKKQIMDYFWGVDRENQYINEYNIAMNNLTDDNSSLKYIEKYKQFLVERMYILDKFESDFKSNFYQRTK